MRKLAILFFCAVMLLSAAACGKKDNEAAAKLTDEEALAAIRNYCCIKNPDLEAIVTGGEYPAYWEIASGDEEEVVVLFRSYTGVLVRYYINRETGDTGVTEFVPGITPEEQQTDESFNARDYLPES